MRKINMYLFVTKTTVNINKVVYYVYSLIP